MDWVGLIVLVPIGWSAPRGSFPIVCPLEARQVVRSKILFGFYHPQASELQHKKLA